MNKSQFDYLVRSHLSEYNKGKEGWYKYKGRYVYHKHILYLSDECKTNKDEYKKQQKEVIQKFALTTPAKNRPFLWEHIHYLAHHLTSSQIMCYNFFRPLINDKGIPTPQLLELFKTQCPDLELDEGSKAIFEYVEKGEKTNFDFYLQTSSKKIFCEIKYTEENFAKKCNANQKDHFKTQYSSMIEDCSHLWNSVVDEDGFMNGYFQLFRNVLRARTENDYVFFIYPKDRSDLRKSFDSFKNTYLKDDIKNIVFITWESLVNRAKEIGINVDEFEDRYLKY